MLLESYYIDPIRGCLIHLSLSLSFACACSTFFSRSNTNINLHVLRSLRSI